MLEAVLDFLETKAIKRHLARSPASKKKGGCSDVCRKISGIGHKRAKIVRILGKLWQICSRRGERIKPGSRLLLPRRKFVGEKPESSKPFSS